LSANEPPGVAHWTRDRFARYRWRPAEGDEPGPSLRDENFNNELSVIKGLFAK
jgi:hypothetical protein